MLVSVYNELLISRLGLIAAFGNCPLYLHIELHKSRHSNKSEMYKTIIFTLNIYHVYSDQNSESVHCVLDSLYSHQYFTKYSDSGF